MINWDLLLECEDVSTYENQCSMLTEWKEKYPYDLFIDAEAFDKVLTPFYDKNNKLGI